MHNNVQSADPPLSDLLLGSLSECKPFRFTIALGRRCCRRSFGSPSGFHRRRKLRTAFGCDLAFFLHLLDRNPFTHTRRFGRGLCRQASLALLKCSDPNGDKSFASPSCALTPSLSQSRRLRRFEFLFQARKFLRTFLQARFKPLDLLGQPFSFHRQVVASVGPPTRGDINLMTEPEKCHVIVLRYDTECHSGGGFYSTRLVRPGECKSGASEFLGT